MALIGEMIQNCRRRRPKSVQALLVELDKKRRVMTLEGVRRTDQDQHFGTFVDLNQTRPQ
jgi:hypothetical protein